MMRAECVFRDGTIIQDYGQPYFVAEVNSSHNGNVEVARKMVDAAVSAGCHCVKFQSWSASSLYSQTYYKENPIARRFVDKFSLSPNQLKSLADYCTQQGISFSSTPYAEEEVDFLADECNVPFVKIASMELNHPSFLQYIGKKRLPVVLSTGMSEMEEVEEAVDILHRAGVEQMVLLHCVSIYPTRTELVNLRNIIGLRKAFSKHPIGFSDHTEGDAAAVAAVALGASLLEKHLTLDRSKVGMDNSMAMEPDDLRILVEKCAMVQEGLGSEQRRVLPEEYEQRKKMRRSICVTRSLSAGHVLKREDLCAKRPGSGISPQKIDSIVGSRLKSDVEADTLLRLETIEA